VKNKLALLFGMFVFWCNLASAQTFTFECICAPVTGDTCDICPTNTALDSRTFNGLLVYRNGIPYKWIDEPYTIKRYLNSTLEFLEQIPSPDKVTIAISQTPYWTMSGFVDSTTCFCNTGGGTPGGDSLNGIYTGSGRVPDSTHAVIDSGIVFQGNVPTTFFQIDMDQGLYGTDYYQSDDTLQLLYYDVGGTNKIVVGPAGVEIRADGPDRVTVNGAMRVTDLVTDPSTHIVGTDADGDLNKIVVGVGIDLTNDTLTNSGDLIVFNEGLLGVAAGGANNAIITSNTFGAIGDTIAGGTGIAISESMSLNGGTITITNTGDLLATNEGVTGVAAGGANDALLTSNTSGAVGTTFAGGTGITISESTAANGGTITITSTATGTVTGTGLANKLTIWNNATNTGYGLAFSVDTTNKVLTLGTVGGDATLAFRDTSVLKSFITVNGASFLSMRTPGAGTISGSNFFFGYEAGALQPAVREGWQILGLDTGRCAT